MKDLNKKSYSKPEIAELNALNTNAIKQTPSTTEGQNPGMGSDPKFGDFNIS